MTEMLSRPAENIGTDFYLNCDFDSLGKLNLISSYLKGCK